MGSRLLYLLGMGSRKRAHDEWAPVDLFDYILSMPTSLYLRKKSPVLSFIVYLAVSVDSTVERVGGAASLCFGF